MTKIVLLCEIELKCGPSELNQLMRSRDLLPRETMFNLSNSEFESTRIRFHTKSLNMGNLKDVLEENYRRFSMLNKFLQILFVLL
jgi:hypothetical protein